MARRQDRHERMLLDLLRQPGNDVCADCKAKAPRWASVNLGIFICMRCGGIHRKMGTHISKVKSVSVDHWTMEQIEMMRKGGNIAANKLMNPHPERHPLPIALDDDHAMEKYIREKWEKKLYMDKKEEPPAQDSKRPVPKRSTTSPLVGSPNKVIPMEALVQRLQEMGFRDPERNRQVLVQTSGNLENAVEILMKLGGPTAPVLNMQNQGTVEQKLAQLIKMGYNDPLQNIDMLKRAGGNVQVAAGLLKEQQQQRSQSANLLTNATANTPNGTSSPLVDLSETTVATSNTVINPFMNGNPQYLPQNSQMNMQLPIFTGQLQQFPSHVPLPSTMPQTNMISSNPFGIPNPQIAQPAGQLPNSQMLQPTGQFAYQNPFNNALPQLTTNKTTPTIPSMIRAQTMPNLPIYPQGQALINGNAQGFDQAFSTGNFQNNMLYNNGNGIMTNGSGNANFAATPPEQVPARTGTWAPGGTALNKVGSKNPFAY